MANPLGNHDPIYDLSRIASGLNQLPGGGSNSSSADANYLRLDTTNDPLTGPLDIITDDDHALQVLTEGTSGVYSFPVTPILDTFPVDGGPPPNANWTTPATAESGLVVDGGKLSSLVGTNLDGQAVWSPLSGLTDTEVYIDTVPNPAAIEAIISVYACIQDPDDLYAGSYVATLTYFTPSYMTLTLGTWYNGGFYGTPINFPWALGDSLGMRVRLIDGKIVIKAYHKPFGGSWSSAVASGGVSAPWFTSGKIGVGISANDSAPDAFGQCDNFGGGQVPAGQYSESVFNVDTLTHLTTAEQIEITQPDGIAPLVITSETLNTNLNADLLDGQHAAAFAPIASAHNPVTLDTNADTLLSLSTQQIGLDVQSANRILAGPTTGAAAAPTFRSLVSADVPAGVSPIGAALTRGSLYRGSAANAVEALAHGIAGAVLTGDGTDTFWSTFALAGTAAQTYTFPAAGGTVAMLNAANVFTAAQTITPATDVVGLTINKPSTADPLTVMSGATKLAGINQRGQAMFGGAYWPSTTKNGLTTYILSSGSGQYGGFFQAQLNGDHAGVSSLVGAFNFTAITNTQTLNDSPSSISAGATFGPSVATITEFSLYKTNCVFGVGALSLLNHYVVYDAIKTGGTLTKQVGVKINDLTAAGTNGAIETGKGAIALGDKTTITNWQDVQALIVTGHTTQTLSPFQVTRADAASGVRNMAVLDSAGDGANNTGGAIALLGKSSTTAATSMAAINWLYSTATHASLTTKIALQNRTNAGALTDRLAADGATITLTGDVNITGDTWWTTAGGGLPLGSFYGLEINQLQNSAAQNTWYLVSMAAISDGQLNLVTHDGSGKLTMSKAGLYLVNWSMTLEANANNKHLAGDVAVNGTVTGQAQAHIESVTNQELVIGGTAILSLAANATVELAFRTTDTGTPNINVDDVNFSIVQIGA